MRLLFEGPDKVFAERLSHFLTEKNIENVLEFSKITDWGSADYGTFVFRIWVVEEDQFENGQKFLQEYSEAPDHPRFEIKPITVERDGPSLSDAPPIPMPAYFTPFVTYYLLALCTAVHLLSSFLAWGKTEESSSLPL
jgi:hypothetical protein